MVYIYNNPFDDFSMFSVHFIYGWWLKRIIMFPSSLYSILGRTSSFRMNFEIHIVRR
jgi:hypothetical protein